MGIAALIAWIITAGGGATLLGVWLRRGGLRQQADGTTSFRPEVIFSHFLLAAAGLVIWVVYVVADIDILTWVAFAILVVVAALGATMFTRWLGVRSAKAEPVGARAGGPAPLAAGARAGEDPAERHLPVPVVALHGLLAVVTLVLVLLAALGVGGS